MEKQLYLSSSPHIHSGETTDKVMRAVIYALLPACAVAVYLFGLPALSVLLICTLGCVAAESVCQRLMGKAPTIADGSAALTGLLLALNLPPSSPWWLALIGSLVAIGVGKQVYGGLGYNPFNPALVARVVLLISFPVQMTTWTAPSPLGSGIDAVTESLDTINRHHWNVVPIFSEQLFIRFNVDFFERETIAASGVLNGRFRLVAEVAPRSGIDDDVSST